MLLGPGGAGGRQDPQVSAGAHPAPPCAVDTALSSLPTEAGGPLKAQGWAVVRPCPEARGLFEPPCGPLRDLPCHRPDGGASRGVRALAQPTLPALPRARVTTSSCPLPGLLWAGPGALRGASWTLRVAAPARTLSADLRGRDAGLCFVHALQGAPPRSRPHWGVRPLGCAWRAPAVLGIPACPGSTRRPSLAVGAERRVCVQV